MKKKYYVYIITNRNNNVLYIGITNNLKRRIYEHREKLISGFSKKYNLKKLVYYESTSDVKSAILREKQLKNWHREWKINLITRFNNGWKDLSDKLWDSEPSSE
ncbi:GIY-YIG nuclease family protein [candidate division WOR-3 bacterium]|nr:GIY-YIG nuclease family protein [candidate division WOR-3 bacterium]